METNFSYTLVGIFIISLITAIALGVIWLSSGFSFEKYRSYLVFMQESVSGLNIDSVVEYNGVEVGKVVDIRLSQHNPQLVEVELKVKASTPITRGTTATLNTRGLTGLTYMALKDKSNDLRPPEIPKGEIYPVIKTAPSIFTRLDTALSEVSSNLQKVANSIQSVLDKDNQQSIKKTLANLQLITANLAENNAQLTTILNNTAMASQRLSPLIKASSSSAQLLESQTLPAANQLLTTLNELTQSIKQNPAILVRGQIKQRGPGE